MDPTPLATAEWTAIGKLITNLWIMVALVVFMATNVIIGLMFIPSLVASHQLPASVQKSRPLFYALAVVSFALTLVFLAQTVDRAGVIRSIYETFWIDGGVG